MQTRGLRARLPRVPGQGAARLRGRLMLELAVLRGPRTASSRRCGARAPAGAAEERRSTRAAAASCARSRATAGSQHAVGEPLDVRTLCLARETLAYHDALADFAFAMQGLGSGADLAVRRRRPARALPAGGRRRATKIAAFALSEPDAGSDVAAMTTTARRRRAADRRPRRGSPTAGSRTSTPSSRARAPEGISAFVVDAGPRSRSPSAST